MLPAHTAVLPAVLPRSGSLVLDGELGTYRTVPYLVYPLWFQRAESLSQNWVPTYLVVCFLWELLRTGLTGVKGRKKKERKNWPWGKVGRV